jgi:serine phosphatase RsbU (regulator of sigma subunit)
VLDLKDFYHLPQVDALIAQMVADGPGLVIVAGFDPQSAPAQSSFLPSGRAGVFRMLMRQMLMAKPNTRAVVVTVAHDEMSVPRGMTLRVEVIKAQSAEHYADSLAKASSQRPDLLVVDRLNQATATAVMDAAGSGLHVLAQMDTVLRGSDIARQLMEWGIAAECLSNLTWVIALQRLSTLCPTCRQVDDAAHAPSIATYYRITQQGCNECNGTGRKGDVTLFDIFHAEGSVTQLLRQPSAFSMQQYARALAEQGLLSLQDVAQFEAIQTQRLQQLLASSERAWAESNAALQRKLIELEAANRVLQQRTEALISLERLGAALISTVELRDLANAVCRYAQHLCGAERAILYLLRPPTGPARPGATRGRTRSSASDMGRAEVLAVCGWNPRLVGQTFNAEKVFEHDLDAPPSAAQPAPFRHWPPGVPFNEPDLEGARIYQGLRLPLVAQDKLVGLLIVHPTTKPRFAPGEAALLRTLAAQAALAIQRAELVESLRGKIAELETAQAALISKERLDHELALARQVQESLLPRRFPDVPGYAFAARSIPARQVGGDFYDVIRLDEHHFGVVIADVSDKGMPAALFMALTRSLLMAEAERELSPRAVLAHINRLLLALTDSEMFVAMFYGVVDTRTCALTYARAGHDKPLVLHGSAALSLQGQGTVLGWMDAQMLHLTEEQAPLAPGDRLVLFTDGMTDVADPRGELFGLPRLTELLRANAHLPAAELCDAVFQRLERYRDHADQYDDMAMLVVQVQ